MSSVKPLDTISAKWQRVASVSQESYTEGVNNPRADWAKATADAEARYTTGVQQAISAKRFGKGVARAGTAKWQKGATEKGPGRWSQGISLAGDAYKNGFQPYHAELGRIVYPAKGAKGDPNNNRRVDAVTKAMHELKLKLKGGA